MKKRFLPIILALIIVLGAFPAAMAAGGTISGTGTAEDPYLIEDAADLTAALANGGEIKMTADITTTAALTTSGVTATIDLNGKTLTIGAGDNKFNDASNITIKNGNIDITGVTVNGNAIFCLDEYEETLATTVTLENVNLTGNGYSSAYGIFYIGDSSVLNVNGGEWTLSNDTFEAGGVFKADDAKATLKITGTNMTLHNVRRVVTYAQTTIAGSTIAITGDADGVDAEMEHGFNRSPLTITDSTITMENLVGRGITAECGAVSIANSTVTITNAQEATIDVRGGQTVTVDSDSTVTLDADPTFTSGAISGTVTVKYAATIDETGYSTVAEAFAAAVDGNEVKINEAGTYSVPTGKDITITGAVADVVFDNIGAKNMGGADVTFNNVTFDYLPNTTYTGLQHAGNLTYNNCTINGTVFLYGTSETFTGCTFNVEGDAYNVWTYGAKKVNFNGCTFNSDGKSVLVYNEGAGATDLTVTDTDFIASAPVEGKAAIEIDSQYLNYAEHGYHNIVVDDASTATGFDEGSVSGSTLYNNKKGNLAEVTVKGEKVLEVEFAAQIGETKYLTLQEALNAAVLAGDTVTVTLLDNIDLTGETWTPVYFNSYRADGANTLVIDGNGKTITGLSDMLFSGIWTGTKFEVKNLTIDKATIKHDVEDTETIGVGAIVGNVSAIENVVLTNVKLTNSHVEGGHWTGGLLGYVAGYSGTDGPVFTTVTIEDCSVTDSTITGKGSVGGVVGHATGDAWTDFGVETTTITGNTITSTGSDTNKAGVVMGTIGAAGTAKETNGTTLTGGVSVSVTESGNTATSNGTAITTVYGRQGSSTGVLTITGGTYENYPIEQNVSYVAPKVGYTIYKNANGTYGLIEATDDEISKSATITFTVSPIDAIIKVEKNGTEFGGTDNKYELPGGTYTYTVSKDGYDTKNGTFAVEGEDKPIEVTLSETYYAPTYRVTVEKADNGAVKSSATYATQGQRVTITVTPDDGYLLDTLTVVDAKGNEIEVTDKGDGKYTFKMPGRKVTVTASFLYDLPYTDVAVEDEFYDAVCFLHQQGLINGMGNNLYQPETSFNRAMIATMLHRLAGLPEYEQAANLTDVADGVWYTDAIHWGTEAGLITGYPGGIFDPGKDISVRELVVFLYRYAQYAENPDCDKSDWTGATWADAGLAWADANDLLPAGEDLNAPASRALAAQVIYNVYNLLNK